MDRKKIIKIVSCIVYILCLTEYVNLVYFNNNPVEIISPDYEKKDIDMNTNKNIKVSETNKEANKETEKETKFKTNINNDKLNDSSRNNSININNNHIQSVNTNKTKVDQVLISKVTVENESNDNIEDKDENIILSNNDIANLNYELKDLFIDIKNFNVKIPEYISKDNTNKDSIINDYIKSKIIELNEPYIFTNNSNIDLSYKINISNENYLSISFTENFIQDSYIYPIKTNFSININNKEKEIVNLSNFISKEDLYSKYINNNYEIIMDENSENKEGLNDSINNFFSSINNDSTIIKDIDFYIDKDENIIIKIENENSYIKIK